MHEKNILYSIAGSIGALKQCASDYHDIADANGKLFCTYLWWYAADLSNLLNKYLDETGVIKEDRDG